MKYTLLKQDNTYAIVIDGVPPIIIPNRSGPIIGNFSEVLVIPIKVEDNQPVENFIAINNEGNIVWKFNEDNYLEVKYKFVHLLEENKDELWFKNIAGKEYKIDYKTGKVLETRYENMDFSYTHGLFKIENKEIELEIPAGDGGKVVINQVFCWRGQIVFVLYNTHKPKRLDEHRFQHFDYIVAFDKKGEKLWQKSDIEFKGGVASTPFFKQLVLIDRI